MQGAGLVCGAAIGGGLFLVVRELLPSRPDMEAVLDRLEQTQHTPAASASGSVAATSLWERAGESILKSAGHRLSVPRADLDLLGKSPAHHVGTKVVGSLLALVMPQLAVLLLMLGGTALPFAWPLLGSVLFAAYIWFSADADVRSKAKAARLEVRYAVASFLERAQLERGANVGPEAAVQRTAEVGDHWILTRIRAALKRSELAGLPQWEALRQLGEQLDIPELVAPAESFSLAGAGASIQKTLETQAVILRQRLLTDKQAAANAASERLVVPGTVLFAVTLALFAYPAFHALTSI
ncbi:hypothetical protein [Streptomyces sp. NBC_01500]|uniref:hypothetical protein n=1 Tax=Streptomyces sp. NBC_01500 TaxID=2903886 RepID=UPI00225743A3|nr:hypothetical protein [Streptomyces sp. NBC_01500]MCX4554237.1 hypothetical protein [Streptomyces sp. NBC_01500]